LDFQILTVALLLDHAQGWHFEALAHERVADFLDPVTDHAAVLVNNHVNALFNIALVEWVEVGQGLTSGGSEKKACHAFLFVVFDCASNEADVDSTLDILVLTLSNNLLSPGSIRR